MVGAAQLAVYDPATCYYWGGADGRRDSAAAGVNIGAASAITLEQRCAAINNARAADIPR